MRLTSIIFALITYHFSESIKNPIILIPGMGYSRIDVKIDRNAEIKSICKKSTYDNFFTIWVNEGYGFTHTPYCMYEPLKLNYNVETRQTNNCPGVYSRIPGFGSTDTVEYVDTASVAFPYYNKLVKRMVQEGYTRGLSIRAAPYDFRKGPHEYTEYFLNLKQLIEETYENNGRKKVVLIVHSMGGPISLLFLQQQTPEWKKQYIRFEISLSAAWAGSVKAIESYMLGFGLRRSEFVPKRNYNFPTVLSPKTTFPYITYPALPLIPKRLIRTCPGFIWMFPSPEAWKETEVLLRINDKYYTLQNMEEFFRDVGETNGWEMYKDRSPFVNELAKPDIELHCLYGTGVPTVGLVYVKNSFWDYFRRPICGDGDGAVNLQSLEVCKKWTDGTQKVTTKDFWGLHHLSIMSDSKILDHIVNLINGE